MKEERSDYWSRDQTYSVVVRDGSGTLLNRLSGINSASAIKLREDQKAEHPSLVVTLHLDIQIECLECDGTGLWNVNIRSTCPKCEGRGAVISDEIGEEAAYPDWKPSRDEDWF